MLVEHRHEFELALRRQSRLGLVEKIDAARPAAEPGIEEGEEGLAVAARMQAARAQGRDLVVLLIGPLDIGDEVEEALGGEEEAVRHLGQPGQSERGGEAALVALAAIGIVAAAAAAVEAGIARDRFQQARLSRTVLADEKRYRMGEIEREAAAPHEGQGEGKAAVLALRLDRRDAQQEGRGELRARIGTGRAVAGHGRRITRQLRVVNRYRLDAHDVDFTCHAISDNVQSDTDKNEDRMRQVFSPTIAPTIERRPGGVYAGGRTPIWCMDMTEIQPSACFLPVNNKRNPAPRRP